MFLYIFVFFLIVLFFVFEAESHYVILVSLELLYIDQADPRHPGISCLWLFNAGMKSVRH